MVLIALNLDPKQVADVTIDMPGCANVRRCHARFVYTSGASALRPLEGSIATRQPHAAPEIAALFHHRV